MPTRSRRGKKILEDLEDHFASTIQPLPAPKEWTEFRLCVALKCLPRDLDGLPEWQYRLWQTFLSAYEQTKPAGMM
jgi:hypothetical protein